MHLNTVTGIASLLLLQCQNWREGTHILRGARPLCVRSLIADFHELHVIVTPSVEMSLA